MAILIFEDRGWHVATASWTAATSRPSQTTICYLWGADGISWADSATGVARVTFNIPIGEFYKLIAERDVVDLR